MFLAARSLWMKSLLERWAIPSATCLENFSRRGGRSGCCEELGKVQRQQ